jgi:hypothetical protein
MVLLATALHLFARNLNLGEGFTVRGLDDGWGAISGRIAGFLGCFRSQNIVVVVIE